MPTFGQLTDRIAGELARSNIRPEIQNAIRSAIALYEAEHWDFNRRIISLPMLAGENTLDPAASPGLGEIWKINTVSIDLPTRLQLRQRSAQWLEDRTGDNISGDPTDWAWFGPSIWLYPTPRRDLIARLMLTAAQPPLQADADTNAWTQQGADLIRCAAKAMVAMDVLRGAMATEDAPRWQAEAAIFLSKMEARKSARAPGRIIGEMSERGRRW